MVNLLLNVNLFFILCACLLAGCASKPVQKQVTLADLNPTNVVAMAKARPSIVRTNTYVRPSFITLPAFIYPPYMTNYVWSLQWSFNLVNWQTFNSADGRMTNLMVPPHGTWDVWTRGDKYVFFRMKGNRL